MKTVGFIGSGNIASAIIPQLLQHNFCDNNHLYVFDIHPEKTDRLKQHFHIEVASSPIELVTSCDMIILSLKPFVIHDVISEIKDYVTTQLILSPAAGVTVNDLISSFEQEIKITRIMPNLGALVGLSMTSYISKNVTTSEERTIQQFLLSFGKYVQLPEDKFDSFTTLCGSSPAFFANYIQSMVEYAVNQGYDLEQARTMITQTMFATSNILLHNTFNEQELINRVATKGGTTEAGLNMFKALHMDRIIKTGLEASTKRSTSLQKK